MLMCQRMFKSLVLMEVRSFNQDEFKISTIRQPIELMAKKSVEALINIIEDKPVEKKVILPISFIKGYTTK